jgi:predicted AlkP superfamily pyrophosphatase or phosphodiesterase
MRIMSIIIFIWISLILTSNCHKHSDHPLMLLISFDGFRWDYLKTHNLSNFNALIANGSHAEFIYNTFSTITFPNHWTLVTGRALE